MKTEQARDAAKMDQLATEVKARQEEEHAREQSRANQLQVREL